MSEKSHELHREDRARMDRLYEEIQVRIQEMAMIGIRVASAGDAAFAKLAKEGNGVHQFLPRPASTGAEMRMKFEGTEIVCYGSGPNMCLCYNYDLGVCRRC